MGINRFDTSVAAIGGLLFLPSVCLDCFQTRPDQVRAAIARDTKMAAELAAGRR